MAGPAVTPFGVLLFVLANLYFSYLMFKLYRFLTRMKEVEARRRPRQENVKGIFGESLELFSQYRKDINNDYNRMRGE